MHALRHLVLVHSRARPYQVACKHPGLLREALGRGARVMAPKKAAEAKRKAKVEDEVDLADEDESPPQKKPRAKPKPKAAPKTEPYDAENGWHVVPPSILWK